MNSRKQKRAYDIWKNGNIKPWKDYAEIFSGYNPPQIKIQHWCGGGVTSVYGVLGIPLFYFKEPYDCEDAF